MPGCQRMVRPRGSRPSRPPGTRRARRSPAVLLGVFLASVLAGVSLSGSLGLWRGSQRAASPRGAPPALPSPAGAIPPVVRQRLASAEERLVAGDLRAAQNDYLVILLSVDPDSAPAWRGLVAVRRRWAGEDPVKLRRQAEAYRLAIARGGESRQHYSPQALELLAKASLRAATELETERPISPPTVARTAPRSKPAASAPVPVADDSAAGTPACAGSPGPSCAARRGLGGAAGATPAGNPSVPGESARRGVRAAEPRQRRPGQITPRAAGGATAQVPGGGDARIPRGHPGSAGPGGALDRPAVHPDTVAGGPAPSGRAGATGHGGDGGRSPAIDQDGGSPPVGGSGGGAAPAAGSNGSVTTGGGPGGDNAGAGSSKTGGASNTGAADSGRRGCPPGSGSRGASSGSAEGGGAAGGSTGGGPTARTGGCPAGETPGGGGGSGDGSAGAADTGGSSGSAGAGGAGGTSGGSPSGANSGAHSGGSDHGGRGNSSGGGHGSGDKGGDPHGGGKGGGGG